MVKCFPTSTSLTFLLSYLVVLIILLACSYTPVKSQSNKTKAVVTWDRYSLLIDGERVFIQSGEFHPWRLPSEGQWIDILQKFAAAGLNTVSIYVHWGLVNPIKGRTDWSGFRALQPIFDGARQVGLWVIVRPGPYINAETTAGGIPGWVTTLDCPLRTNSTIFDAAWRDYWIELAELVEPNQVGRPNGTVIAVQVENEYITDSHSFQGQPLGKDGYMRDLTQSLRDNGIYVPLTFNDANMDNNFVNGPGSVDIYGFDSYPQSFNCSRPDYWKPVVDRYAKYQASLGLNSPLYIPEFQGGAFDPWGPHAAGYTRCRELTGSAFESVFFLNNLAANAKMISYYMVYGGTSWGYLPFPGVYTSYDYGAAISEDRSLTDKYTELKRQSLFLRSAKEFYKTDIVGHSHSRTYCLGQDEAGYVTELRNRDTGAGFYILRATNSTSLEPTSCTLNVLTSIGPILLPQISLRPRRSRLLVTDYRTVPPTSLLKTTKPVHLIYTTSNLLLSTHIGGREVLYLFSDDERESEEHLSPHRQTTLLDLPSRDLNVHITSPNGLHSKSRLETTHTDDGKLRVDWSILPDQSDDVIAIYSAGAALLLTSEKVAGQVWNPILFNQSSLNVSSSSLLVWGPFTRNASLVTDQGRDALHLWGDAEEGKNNRVMVYVGLLNIQLVFWNGNLVTDLATSPSEFLSFDVYPHSFHELMTDSKTGLRQVGDHLDLGNFSWTYRDSLPELQPDFVDDDWVDADHTESTSPFKKLFGKYYLYACDYGFCNGATIWRGHFGDVCSPEVSQITMIPKAEPKSGIRLVISGGRSFAASVWINGVFINTTVLRSSSESQPRLTDQIYTFPLDSINKCGSNVITVVQDSMGMDQTEDSFSDTVKHPRGILGYTLYGGTLDLSDAITWKVQGQLGGFYWLPDPDRGILNENGFHGIRSGWHLPNYPLRNSSDWSHSSPVEDGMSKAGVGFYHTTIDLDFPEGYDVMTSFSFDKIQDEENQSQHAGRYRVEFWVNGWHMGKYVSDLGPQVEFPVHEGILDYQGSNHFALALWAMDQQGARIEKLALTLTRVLKGGSGPVKKSNPVYLASRRQRPTSLS